MYYFGNILGLAGWLIFGLIFLLIWQKAAPQNWRLGGAGGGVGKPKVSALTVIFAILLTITVIFLFTQIWDDLSNFVKPSVGSIQYPNRYQYKSDIEFQEAYGKYQEAQQQIQKERANLELQRLFTHTAFVIPVLIVALVIFMLLYRRGTAYAAVTLPYFIGAVIITIRLLFDAGSWMVREYQKLGIYIVLGTLLVIFSILTVVIQNWWQRRHESSTKVPL